MKDMGAFPAMTPEAGGYSEGMTLRTYLAGQAMMGLRMSRPNATSELIGKMAKEDADALLAELAKEE